MRLAVHVYPWLRQLAAAAAAGRACQVVVHPLTAHGAQLVLADAQGQTAVLTLLYSSYTLQDSKKQHAARD